uniref:Trehalose synthase/amylase TreS (MTase))) n=1 Tax=Ganoderma boninense TaxID=34458 RepID=A0A5K1K6X6_9APHY|nr:Trehalose synthase/amylase TreS (EC (EC (Maltose alpha-D-glucosyltransferase) (MTase) [Ganoderma boninense]
MSVVRDIHIPSSGPQLLDDLARTIAQILPSLRLPFLSISVLHLVLRWLLAAPTRGREAVRRYLRGLKSRIRRQSRLPRLYFADGDGRAEAGWLDVRDEKGVRRMAFRDFVRSKCPSLLREYKPSKMLFNGHLQTAFNAYGDFSEVDKIVKLIRLLDGGTLSLDFTPPEDERYLSDDPIIVTFHGLTGGSNEAYVRSILAPACASVEDGGLGYRAVVVNFRGCAGTPVTSEKLYHCGNTDDARQALMYISHRYPKAKLIGLGFSLGANVLVRYLAQEGQRSRLTAGCALACPWDLHSVSYNLSNGAWVDRMYSRMLAENMAALIKAHKDKLARNPKLTTALPYLFSLRAPTLWDFDSYYACEEKTTETDQNTGYHGMALCWRAQGDFYRWASSHTALAGVRVPLLAINADDDPIVRTRDLPSDVGGNPLVALVVTHGGGHLGWFTSSRRRTRWARNPVLEWLRAVGQDLAINLPQDPARAVREREGYLCHAERPGLGCRLVEGGGKFRGELLQLGVRGVTAGF